jgi:uncharacterized protein YkwD
MKHMRNGTAILSAAILAMALGILPAAAEVSTKDAPLAARMVNGWRASHGLPPLKTDPQLNRVAQIQTAAMMAQGAMSHDAGGDFRTRMRSNGVRGTAAENLAAGTANIEQVMSMWQNSAGHNANLLNPEMARVGLAKGVTPSGYVYWTMVFAGR